jgi:hypothetical protein
MSFSFIKTIAISKSLIERYVPWHQCRDRNVSNPWVSYTIERAIVERDIAHRTWSNQKTAANKSRFINHRLLDPKLASRVLWRNLDGMGVRDSGGSDVIYSSEELCNFYSSLGEDDAPMDRSQGAPPVMDCFLFPMLLTGRFLMQSVVLNLRRWGWTESRLGSLADNTVDLADMLSQRYLARVSCVIIDQSVCCPCCVRLWRLSCVTCVTN